MIKGSEKVNTVEMPLKISMCSGKRKKPTGLSIEEFGITSRTLFYVFIHPCLSDQDAMDEEKC